MSHASNLLMHWILGDDGEPQAVGVLEWAEWFETQPRERIVLRDTVRRGIEVSTVFLGLDHDFFMHGTPVLWESMIFGGPFDGHQDRYTSKLEALEGHADCVRLVEQYFNTPRKTKKVLGKFWADPGGCRLHPGEQRRLLRALLALSR